MTKKGGTENNKRYVMKNNDDDENEDVADSCGGEGRGQEGQVNPGGIMISGFLLLLLLHRGIRHEHVVGVAAVDHPHTHHTGSVLDRPQTRLGAVECFFFMFYSVLSCFLLFLFHSNLFLLIFPLSPL